MASSDSFLSSIDTYPPVLKEKLRKLRAGIFIPEHSVGEVESLYRSWLAEHKITIKTDEKLDQRMFGAQAPQLCYLPEGQDCLCGFLAPVDKGDEGAAFEGVPKSESSVISGVSFLHPKDTWFSDRSDIKVRRSATQGTYVEFRTGGNTSFSIKESLVRSLAELLRSSGRFSSEFPDIQRSLRDVVVTLGSILARGRFASSKKPLFIPSGVSLKESSFFIYKNLVLVFGAGNVLTDFYELRGRNFRNRVLDEIRVLKGTNRSRAFEALEICASRSSDFYVRAKVKGKFLSIDTSAIIDLVDMVPLSNWMLSKVPSRYTVQDVLVAIGGALKYADWVNMSALSAEQKQDSSQGKARFQLKYIPWTFITGRKNNIVRFTDGSIKSRPQNKKPGKRPPSPKKNS
jgi:hypothetical protein